MAASMNYVLTDNSYYSYSYEDWGDRITDTSTLTGSLQVNFDESFTTFTIDYSNVLLNGSSFRPIDTLVNNSTEIFSGTLISGFGFDYDIYGNASLSPFPLICIECSYEMTFNLFPNSLVLSYHEFNPFNTGEVDFELFVSQVPLPATVWLFGSGIIGLIGVARRKKA